MLGVTTGGVRVHSHLRFPAVPRGYPGGGGATPLVVGHPSTVPQSILTRGVLTPPPSPPYIDARLASVAILTHPPNAHP